MLRRRTVDDMIRTFRHRSALQQALLLLAAAVVLALLVVEGANTGFVPTAAATVATGALCVAALVVRPARFPLVAAGAVTASAVLTVVTTQLTHRPENTPGMTELCALLLVTARAVRLLPLLRTVVLVPAAACAAGVLLLRMPGTEWHTAATFVAPFVLLGAVLAVVLGLYLRVLDTLRERERLADRQDQRLEYARELHDFVAHHITAIVAQTKAVRFATASGHAPAPAALDTMLGRIEEAGSEAMESMRGIVSVLRTAADPAATRPGSTLDRIRPLVADFARTGPPAELTLDPRLTDRPLPPELTTAVHGLVRESLTNIRKHGVDVGRVTVDVRLRPDDAGRLEVTVADDGRVARAGLRARGDGGYGLLGLAERIEGAGGHFTAGPDAAGGWRVAADLPLRTERR
ncbi:histidine kinase [Streptomyces olivaceiscleroticus]|uniref:histidine kinase n=2 Tax=Streptomyces olivaceiscleroticus TaxID=68245 RepID=A0ABN0ZAW4_9ACTN